MRDGPFYYETRRMGGEPEDTNRLEIKGKFPVLEINLNDVPLKYLNGITLTLTPDNRPEVVLHMDVSHLDVDADFVASLEAKVRDDRHRH
jgi:hypothetical protein